ncbi:hypothetical protein B0H63DRAFT_492468 [Podospora didyma]|uniref:DUF8212 domain-containing protein n=1 Tax=Podospora didyma TaxID=330526 RepID=A0AAE0NXJ8_9PEZI|nr:hypothetical protein B0H63DRAFT_492468 [Podospora didyma]
MRLLNVETRRLENFIQTGIEWSSYTILVTCTWPATRNFWLTKSEQEGYQHNWIGTCCIDKSSKVQVCYAYLSDVDGTGSDDPGHKSSSFRKSRWFTRGWTLQELLAPLEAVFLNRDWKEIGTRKSLGTIIAEVTGISAAALENPFVAQKMSWAALRKPTREEDRAYSLMGLFGVNMPLLYGEGSQKAFARLQREIMKQSTDDSIFAWSNLGIEHWVSCGKAGPAMDPGNPLTQFNDF